MYVIAMISFVSKIIRMHDEGLTYRDIDIILGLDRYDAFGNRLRRLPFGSYRLANSRWAKLVA